MLPLTPAVHRKNIWSRFSPVSVIAISRRDEHSSKPPPDSQRARRRSNPTWGCIESGVPSLEWMNSLLSRRTIHREALPVRLRGPQLPRLSV
jgi:hypothetical protein